MAGHKIPLGKRVKRGALSMMTRPETDSVEMVGVASASTGLAEVGDHLSQSIGKEVKNLRLSLNMASSELALKSGLSNGMISKLERGNITPSITTLQSVAEALNVPISRLFVGHEKRADFSLVRAGQGIDVQRRGATQGFNFQLLGHLLSGEKFIEPYIVTISDDAAPHRGFQHTGIEFMFILKGSMQYRYADALVELYEGDTLVFDSNFIHGHERILDGPVTFLSVVFNLRS